MAGQGRTLFVLGGVLVAGIAAAVWFVMDSDTTTPHSGDEAAASSGAAPEEASAATKPQAGSNRRPKAKGTASVVGEVRRSKGKVPVAEQEVQLLPDKGDPWTVRTDSHGAFKFPELPHGGPYELRVAAPKCGTIRIPGIALDRNEKRDVGTLWLDPSVKVTVTVKSWADQVVEGAVVEAYAVVQADNFDWSKAYAQMGAAPVAVAKASTDAEGKAVFPELATGRWTFTATKQGYARSGRSGVTVRSDVEPPPVKLYLGTGHPLAGKVSDAAKAAVPGALLLAGGPNSQWDLGSAPLRARATTDAQGNYEFPALDAGDMLLMVARPGGTPAGVATLRIPNINHYDVVLKGTATVTGVVTEKDGAKPIEAATVRAWSWTGAGANVAEATTDATGKYSVVVVEGMVNQIVAEKEGWAAADDMNRQQQPLQMREGETQTRDLKLRPGSKITGVVKGPDGPLAGAKVWAHSGSNNTGWQQKSAPTDAEGRYEFASVAPGKVLIRAEYSGHYVKDFPENWWMAMQQQGPSPWKIEVTEGATATKDVEMVRGVAVEGRVEGPDGPMAGVRVSTATDYEGGTTTGEGGTFRVEGVKPSANVYLYAVKDGYAPTAANKPISVSSDKPTTDVVIRMTKVGTVKGTVTVNDGGGLKDAQVRLNVWQDQGGGMEYRGYYDPSAGQAAPVRPDGTYEIPLRGQSSGKFMVTVTALDRPSVSSEAQSIVDGQSDYTVNLAMEGGKDLTGRVVVKQGGAGVPGANVSIQSRGRGRSVQTVNGMYMGDGGGGQSVWAVTDAEGKFSVSHLAAGNYGVNVTATSYVAGNASVDLNATNVVTVELEPELSIEGTVKLGDGTPVVGAQVNAQKDNPQAQPQEMNAGGMNSWTMTGSGGRFKLTGLGTGLFRINVSGDWQGELNIRSKRTDPIASGSADVKIVVDTGGLITGRVTDPQKKGLAGIWIYANPEQKDGKQPEGAEPRNVRTRDDGTFQVAGLSDVATYQLTVQANQGWDMSGGGGLKNAVLKGITVGTANLEVVLEEGLTITGTVVDAEGKPVANSYLQAMLMNADGKGSRMSRNAMTDDKGAFTISGLETGDCQISMMEWGGPGGQLIIQNGDKVPAGSRDVQLVASKGLTITGTVVDESNSAVKGAGISANPKTGGRSRSGRVNQDGTFEITGLAAGTSYKLMANAQGRALGKADDVASGSAGVRLVCPKGLEAAGRVTDEAGSPVKSAQIMLTLPTDTDYRAWAQTDDQGNFKVTGLVDGVYDATCTQRSGPNRNQRKCGVVKAGDMSAALQLVAEGK